MTIDVMTEKAMPRNLQLIDAVTVAYDPGINLENQIDYTIETKRDPVVMSPIFKEDGTFQKELSDVIDAARAAAPDAAVTVTLDELMRPKVEGTFGTMMRRFVSMLTSQQMTEYNIGAMIDLQVRRICKDLDRTGETMRIRHPLYRKETTLFFTGYELPTTPEDTIKVYIPGSAVGKRISDILRVMDGPAWTLSLMQGRSGTGPHGIDWGELGYGRADHATAQALDMYFMTMLYDLQVVRLDIERAKRAIVRWIQSIEPMADIAEEAGRSKVYSVEAQRLVMELEACDRLLALIPPHSLVHFAADIPETTTADCLPAKLPARFETWDTVLGDLPEYTKRKWERNGAKPVDLTTLVKKVVAPLVASLPRYTSKDLLSGLTVKGKGKDKDKETAIDRLYPSQIEMAFNHFFKLKAVTVFFAHAATVLGWKAAPALQLPAEIDLHGGWGVATNGLRFSGDPLLIIAGLALCVPMGESYIHEDARVRIPMWAAHKKGVANHDSITVMPTPLSVTDPTSDETAELDFMPTSMYMGEPSTVWSEEPWREGIDDDVLLSIFRYFRELFKDYDRLRIDMQPLKASDKPEYKASTVVPYAAGNDAAAVLAAAKEMHSSGVEVKEMDLLRWDGETTTKIRTGFARRVIMRTQSRKMVYWAGCIAVAYDYPRGELVFSRRTLTALKFSHSLEDLKPISAAATAAYQARPDIVGN